MSNALIKPTATGLTVFVCIILLVIVFLYTNQKVVLRAVDCTLGAFSKKFAERIRRVFLNIVGGMRIFRSAPDMAKCTFFSLLAWTGNGMSLALTLTAFGIEYPWYTPIMMLALIAVFISVPITPGMVGQYHIAVIAGLLLAVPGIIVSEAKAVALVAHLIALTPVISLGVFCLLLEGFSFLDLISRQTRSQAGSQ